MVQHCATTQGDKKFQYFKDAFIVSLTSTALSCSSLMGRIALTFEHAELLQPMHLRRNFPIIMACILAQVVASSNQCMSNLHGVHHMILQRW